MANCAEKFPALCAHRGLSRVCPENTMPAFGAALGLGVSEIEFDLWLSEDGVCSVCHDNELDRTAGASGKITESRWEEIRLLDAGEKFGAEWKGVRIPRLEEVLELAGGRTLLNIHIKDPGKGGELVGKACALIKEKGLVHSSYIMGGEDVIEAAVKAEPAVPRVCHAVELAVEYGCSRVQFGRRVSDDEIKAAKDAGLVCNLFYSDEPEDARRYLDRGIDVILTNAANILMEGTGLR